MSFIASGGVIVASAALLIVLSVFAGLKEFSLEFSNFTDPDLKIVPAEGKSFAFAESDMSQLNEIQGIETISKIIEERIAVRSENKNVLATLKGVDENYLKVTYIDSMITQGQWITPGTNDVVAGDGISNNLSFGIFNFLKPLIALWFLGNLTRISLYICLASSKDPLLAFFVASLIAASNFREPKIFDSSKPPLCDVFVDLSSLNTSPKNGANFIQT